jgi:hypothetical protein
LGFVDVRRALPEPLRQYNKTSKRESSFSLLVSSLSFSIHNHAHKGGEVNFLLALTERTGSNSTSSVNIDSLVWLLKSWVFSALKYLYSNVGGNPQALRALWCIFSGIVLLPAIVVAQGCILLTTHASMIPKAIPNKSPLRSQAENLDLTWVEESSQVLSRVQLEDPAKAPSKHPFPNGALLSM